MMAVNVLANIVAVGLYQKVLLLAEPDPPDEIWQNPLYETLDMIFTPGAFVFVIVATYLYERPIRAYLDDRFRGSAGRRQIEDTARRRLLNEPFVLIGLDLSMWLLSGVLYGLIFWMS